MDENKKEEIDIEKRQFLKKNFFFVNNAKLPSWWGRYMQLAYVSVATGVFLIIYLNTVLVTIISSSLCMLIGIWATYKWLKPYLDQKTKYSERPNEVQMEAWLIQEIKADAKTKAIEMLSLNKNKIKAENFIIIPIPIYWQEDGIEHIVRLQASGGYYLYSSYKIQILALTDNYVSAYTCSYDWLNNQLYSETTDEFFYDDISSIRNRLEHLEFIRIDHKKSEEEDEEDKGEIGEARVFRLKNMSGETIAITTEIESLEASPQISQKLDKLVQVLRITLRNRRYGETFEVIRPQEEKLDDKEEKQEE